MFTISKLKNPEKAVLPHNLGRIELLGNSDDLETGDVVISSGRFSVDETIAAPMTITDVAIQDLIAGRIGDATFNFSIVNPLPIGGGIRINFPSDYPHL